MKRRRIILIAGFSIAILVALVTAVVMFRALAAAADMRKKRDEAREQLSRFYDRNPFPSEDNISKERTNLETVQEWFGKLYGSVRSTTVPLGHAQPSIFNSRRESLVADLIAKAPMGAGGAKVVSDDFAFGFERYQTGVLADAGDVPRLMRQLTMVEELVREIYAAGVLRVVSLKREEFEGQSAEAAGFEGVRRRGGRRGGGYVEESHDSSGRIDAVVPMTCERFELELLMREESLVELLNRIGRMQMFAVVQKLSLEKEGSDYVPAPTPEKEEAGRSGGAETAAKLPPLSRTARLVSGRDREARLKALVTIGIYGFENEEAE